MVEITATLSAEDGSGYWHEGYADSIAVTPDRLYVRAAWGVLVYGHGLVPRLAQQWDIQGRPGYQKVGDGFQTISNVGTSPDGQRVLLGYKQDTHGTLVLDARYSGNHSGRDGTIIGEFSPPRALGGVTVVQSGGTYTAFALQGGGLSYVDVTAEQLGKLKPKRLLAGRNAQGLLTVGERAAYVDDGSLVLVKPNGATQSLPMRAVTLASEGDVLLVGVEGGYRRLGMDLAPLPATPSAVCLLHGVAYAVVTVGGTQRLYRESEEILVLPPATWPTVQMRGFDRQLYLATTEKVLVVKVTQQEEDDMTLTKQDLAAIRGIVEDAFAGYASGAPKMLASRPDDGIGVDGWTPRPVCANEWDALDNAIHGYNPEGLRVRALTSSYRLDEVGEGGLRHLTELSGNKVTVVVGSFDDAMHELDAAHCLPGDALDFDLNPSGLHPKPIGKRWGSATDPYAVTFLMMAGIIKTAAQLDAEKGQFPGAGFGDSWAFDGQANGTQMARSFTLGEAWAAWQTFRAKTAGTPGAGPGGASDGPVGAGDGGGSKG